MRALLDMMHKNVDAFQDNLVSYTHLLQKASERLTILDPELGEEELVKSLAAELAKVKALIARSSERQ